MKLQAGVPDRAAYYENTANQFKEAINGLLWDETLGCWFDYDFVKKHLRKDFYPSNIVPLWAGAQQSDSTVKRVINYLRTVGALDYPGGIPTSLKQTGNENAFRFCTRQLSPEKKLSLRRKSDMCRWTMLFDEQVNNGTFPMAGRRSRVLLSIHSSDRMTTKPTR